MSNPSPELAKRSLESDWLSRWHSFADLLDARMAQLEARDSELLAHASLPVDAIRTRRIMHDHGKPWHPKPPETP